MSGSRRVQSKECTLDYYTRFERGRVHGVSDEVLAAIARVLRLDDVEQEHLRNLAAPAARSTCR